MDDTQENYSSQKLGFCCKTLNQNSFFQSVEVFFFFWLCWAFVAVCGVRSVVRGLRYPSACGIFISQLGIEPASPTLEGQFLTTRVPEKSQRSLFLSAALVLMLCPPCAVSYPVPFWGGRGRGWGANSLLSVGTCQS